jgi:hypothetical protein
VLGFDGSRYNDVRGNVTVDRQLRRQFIRSYIVVLAFDRFRDNDTNGRGDACLDPHLIRRTRVQLQVLMWLVNFVQPLQIQDGDGEGGQDMAAPSEEGDEGESDGLLGEQGREGGAGGRGHVVGEVQQQRQQQMGKDEMKQQSIYDLHMGKLGSICKNAYSDTIELMFIGFIKGEKSNR